MELSYGVKKLFSDEKWHSQENIRRIIINLRALCDFVGDKMVSTKTQRTQRNFILL